VIRALRALLGAVAVVVAVVSLAWLALRLGRPSAFPPGESVPAGLARHLADAFLRFELGTSQLPGAPPVADLVREGLPADLLLLVGAVVFGLLAGMAGGAVCAARPRSRLARALEVLAVLCVCAPPYVVALSLLLLFGAEIALVDIGIGIPIEYVRPEEDLLAWLGSILVPWIVLGLPLAGLTLRGMRGGMLDTLQEDYVRAARAKGLRRVAVLRRHVAPVAAGSTIALAGASMNLVMLTNLVLVERVFRVPGVFTHTTRALSGVDVSLLLGLTLVGAVLVVAAGLLVDLAVAWLDPRVRR
jgi:peptide/nickel transport system permease protein